MIFIKKLIVSGIYIHIPFCKQACNYCDFHFSTSMKLKSKLIDCIKKEVKLRSDYLTDKNIKTIYFGGGTPSLLDINEINGILEVLDQELSTSKVLEITLEANPDDLSDKYLEELAKTRVNRLSIGIQSFHQKDLTFMNRAHSSDEAHRVLKKAKSLNFLISADLIYGLPGSTMEEWKYNIGTLVNYKIEHISAYQLTLEEKTALHYMVSTGQTKMSSDNTYEEQFIFLRDQLNAAGYEQYEVSNFALPNQHSIHNSNYWKGIHYLGIGPSAHSYDGKSRSWNINNNSKYIDSIKKDIIDCNTEVLSTNDLYNEKVLTQLRTKWGLHIDELNSLPSKYQAFFFKNANKYINKGLILINKKRYTLSPKGIMLADKISSDLFWID